MAWKSSIIIIIAKIIENGKLKKCDVINVKKKNT